MFAITTKNNMIVRIPIIQIRPRSLPLRDRYDTDSLKALARSIKRLGLIQPLSVRKISSDEYELIDGERRLRAAVILGFKKLPCIVVYDCDDNSALLRSLAANYCRSEPDFLDEADIISHMVRKEGITSAELCRTMAAGRQRIEEDIRLGALDTDEKEIIRSYGLTKGHALAALKISDRVGRKTVLCEMIEKGLNVYQSGVFIDEYIADTGRRKRRSQKSTLILKNMRIVENTLEKAIDTLKDSGIGVISEQKETEEYIEYTVRLKKPTGKYKTPGARTA